MAEPPPNVHLELLGTPENVVLVREMLTGVAEAIGLDAGDASDIRTAVTEACNNVVLHAYGGRQGPMDIEVCIAQDSLTVLVGDRGAGIGDRSGAADGLAIGIGIHVIQTLARSVDFRDRSGSDGTEVWMEFAAPSTAALEPARDGLDLPIEAPTGASTTTVSIAPVSLARTILPRVISTLAARAHFSTDRISDAQLLADALAAYAGEAMSGYRLSVGVNVEPRNIELRLAPLAMGRAQQLIGDSELDGLGMVIEKLIDRCGVTVIEAHETLTLGLVDRR